MTIEFDMLLRRIYQAKNQIKDLVEDPTLDLEDKTSALIQVRDHIDEVMRDLNATLPEEEDEEARFAAVKPLDKQVKDADFDGDYRGGDFYEED